MQPSKTLLNMKKVRRSSHNHERCKKGQQLKQLYCIVLYTNHYLPGAEDGISVLSGLVSVGMPPTVDCVLALAVAV